MRHTGICFSTTLLFSIVSAVAFGQQTNDLRQLDLGTLEQRANANDSAAQVELGERYLRGNELPQDYALAFTWHLKAAQQGNLIGEFHVGDAYLSGHGVARDAARGLALWSKAADEGSVLAEDWLGETYASGLNGVPKNFVEARKWFQRAADHGDPSAPGRVEMCDRMLRYGASKAIWSDRQVPDIVKTLDDATKIRVTFTPEEMQKLATRGYSADDLKVANRNQDGVSASQSLLLGHIAEGIFGAQDARVEILFQRGCALPYDETRVTNYCAALGKFYESLGALKMALTVYTLAPKCKTDLGGSASSGPPCLTRAAAIYGQLGDTANARLAYEEICTSYSIPMACSAFKDLGGTVDLDAVRTAYQSNRQEEKEQRRSETADRAERSRESDARFNSLLSTLQSMPGGSDPNAIVNAGNRQAAAIRAIGDANAARQQQDTQMRLASQRATLQTTSQGTKPVVEPATNYQRPTQLATSSTGAQFNVSSSNSSVGTSAIRYSTPLDTSCVRQFWDPNTYNWLSFENNCGQAIYVTIIFHRPGGWAMTEGMHLALGNHRNTGLSSAEIDQAGGFDLYVCPTDSVPVDLSGNVFNANVAQYRCKPQ